MDPRKNHGVAPLLEKECGDDTEYQGSEDRWAGQMAGTECGDDGDLHSTSLVGSQVKSQGRTVEEQDETTMSVLIVSPHANQNHIMPLRQGPCSSNLGMLDSVTL